MQDTNERSLAELDSGSDSAVSDITPTKSTTLDSVYSLLSSTPKDEGKQYIMDLNVTAGVFMVLLLAIITAVLMCCCKTYVMCKKRRQRRRNWDRNLASRRGLHQHLPMSYRYSDEPPTYADILSGRVVSTHNSGCAGTIANTTIEPKCLEESIAVHWSWDADSDSEEPPAYSHVVSQNDVISIDMEGQPPEYYSESRHPRTIFSRMYANSSNDIHFNSVTRRMRNAIFTVSALIPWHKRDSSSTTYSDPTIDISCDGNVMRSSSREVSPSSSTDRTTRDT